MTNSLTDKLARALEPFAKIADWFDTAQSNDRDVRLAATSNATSSVIKLDEQSFFAAREALAAHREQQELLSDMVGDEARFEHGATKLAQIQRPSGDVGELIKELQDIASEDEYENYMRRLAHRCIDEITRLQADNERLTRELGEARKPWPQVTATWQAGYAAGEKAAERRGIEMAVEWHQQRRNETPDAFEMEFHENSAKAILALEPSS